jgi:outer membrane protein assembly factor BamB
MRVASVAIAIVLAVTALASAPVGAARTPSAPARLLVALDEHDGSVLWRARPDGSTGSHVDAKFVTHGLVVAEEFRCDSGNRTYQAGDVSVVAFDARTGRERWRLADYELAAEVFGRLDPPAPDVATLPLRSAVDSHVVLADVATGRIAGPLAAQPIAASADLLLSVTPGAATASASNRGIVTATDRRTGAVRWTRNLGANLFALVLDPSAVVVAAGPIPDPGTDLGKAGGLEVLDAVTGQRRWAAALMPAFGVELAGGRVVFQNLDHLRGVDATTGQPAWDLAVDGHVDQGPASGRTLLVVRAPQVSGTSRTAGSVSALDPGSGSVRWTRRFTRDPLRPGFASGAAVTVATDRRIVAYDAERGRRVWSRPTPAHTEGVVAGGGRVYVSGGCTVSND